MRKFVIVLASTTFFTLLFTQTVFAQDYTVPIIIGDETYTLTVSIDGEDVTVTSGADELEIGEVARVKDDAELAAEQSLDERKANAVTIEYDDLFRYNEEHVGKTVRYVGEVLEFKERPCLIGCKDNDYFLRIAVTEGQYGFWDDPVWVDYVGTDRFLEDDIVTLWGVVEGLESYTALLGNDVTIPKISAIDLVLGEVENPAPAVAQADDEAEEDSAATTATASGPIANRGANLRGGPSTDYPVVGGASEGDSLNVVARNADASWVQLDGGEWISARLVDNLDAPEDLPVAEDIPEPPAVEETTTESSSAASTSPSSYAIGDEIQGNGWRFNVKEVHKRKAVYFYGDPHVAMGHWVVVILDAVNEQSGTDYFYRNIEPYLVDDAGNVYRADGKASGYAEWQYGGLSSSFSDVDPGKLARVAMAFDIPDGVGGLTLSTDVPAWVSLGNFGEMEIEE